MIPHLEALATQLHAFDYANKKRGSHIADGLNRMRDLVGGPLAWVVRDAERYRWLRAQEGRSDGTACVTWNIGHDWIAAHTVELDAAIDQAIAREAE